MGEIQIISVSEKWRKELVDMFSEVSAGDTPRLFHPHEFTEEKADELIKSVDSYYLVLDDGIPVGYGMLRGWAEGYEIPSLGIYISESQRGTGLAKLFMIFLHFAAKNRGAKKVRLKVYKDNVKAVKLYESLGYELQNLNDEEYLGFIEL
jgi:ribosomal-protein-alanine N-acetyltransferase